MILFRQNKGLHNRLRMFSHAPKSGGPLTLTMEPVRQTTGLESDQEIRDLVRSRVDDGLVRPTVAVVPRDDPPVILGALTPADEQYRASHRRFRRFAIAVTEAAIGAFLAGLPCSSWSNASGSTGSSEMTNG